MTLLFDPSMSDLPTTAKQNLQMSDCSPANRERELGLDRRETIVYSTDEALLQW